MIHLVLHNVQASIYPRQNPYMLISPLHNVDIGYTPDVVSATRPNLAYVELHCINPECSFIDDICLDVLS